MKTSYCFVRRTAEGLQAGKPARLTASVGSDYGKRKERHEKNHSGDLECFRVDGLQLAECLSDGRLEEFGIRDYLPLSSPWTT
jgi:hypothetical protein